MEFLNDLLQSDAINQIVVIVIGAVAVWLGTVLSKYYNKAKDKIDAERKAYEVQHGKHQVELLEKLANTAVRFVQQKFFDEDGPAKFDKAMQIMRDNFEKYNIKIGGVHLDEYIESAYITMVNEFKKQQANEAKEVIVEVKTEGDVELLTEPKPDTIEATQEVSPQESITEQDLIEMVNEDVQDLEQP